MPDAEGPGCRACGQENPCRSGQCRYQKCETVTSLARELKMDLVYLPPYSPNLNLIERLWKFVKGRLWVKYYGDFGKFREAIDSIIAATDSTFKEQISRLMGERVQLFDDLQPAGDNTFEPSTRGTNQAA